MGFWTTQKDDFQIQNVPSKNIRKNLHFLKKGIDFIDNRRYNVKLYDIMHKEV